MGSAAPFRSDAEFIGSRHKAGNDDREKTSQPRHFAACVPPAFSCARAPARMLGSE